VRIYPPFIAILCVVVLACFLGCANPTQNGSLPRSDQAKEYYVPSQGDSLFVVAIGSGPPILIVHGGPALNHRYFRPHLDALADDFTVIYYDQRACGKSSVNVDNQTMTIASWVVDMEAIRTYFEIDQWHLLAHSFGALPAINYADRHQDKLLSFVLVGPSAPSSNYRQIEVDELGTRIDDAQALRRVEIISSPSFSNGEMSALVELMKLNFSNVIFDPANLDKLNLEFPSDQLRRSEQMSVLQPELDEFDYEHILPRIKVPSLVLIGSYDPMTLGGGPVYQRALPNNTFSTIEQCGHFPFVEKPEEFNSTLRGFLGSL